MSRYWSLFLQPGTNTCVTLTAAINLLDFRGDFSLGRLLQSFCTCALDSRPTFSRASKDFCQIIDKCRQVPTSLAWCVLMSKLKSPSLSGYRKRGPVKWTLYSICGRMLVKSLRFHTVFKGLDDYPWSYLFIRFLTLLEVSARNM